ncbi:unnamed protein product [Oppiella nova]|uniref:Protein kinase domain-containing protein n=1 Tax=Oppiella nova TaxID=334625 RepID=A0A7R9LHM3_9ACAR|nr:unnamed protein product [Oppiella nova]CAG2163745.1 unnamed protein product [Oppiella nova]
MIKWIQLFHVFDDERGYNILFVTNRGLVYGFGSNYYGSLGLGHNRYVREIQEIERLRHKNITQFFNGDDFVLALTQHNCLYGWGLNNKGQLGLELPNMDFPFIKPELINPENMENKSIYQISCGYYHTMILTSDRFVYGWGFNMYGQLGCGPDSDIQNGTIFRVNFSPNHEIKSIYCCPYSSFAITSKGEVFSWGRNGWYNLGHNSSGNIWKPQLIEDMTVVSEVNQYKRLYKELHLLGSGGFEEVMNYGNWDEDNVYNILMELCSDSLQNILQHKPQVFGRQPEEPMNSIEFYISCHIFKEILECVQYLHELNPPVIHRDLKPDNILVAKTVRNGRFFKIGNFCLATVHQDSSDKGDLRYQAPEVGRGVVYNHKIDVYSLAKIAENIFGIHLEDKPLHKYSDNEVMNKCWLKLTEILHSMSYYNWNHPHIPGPHWTDRPECSQDQVVLGPLGE